MLFQYDVIDPNGTKQHGTIDAANIDIAINSLQRRGLTIATIAPADEQGSVLEMKFEFLQRVSNRDMVILSRQIATLFQAQVSALQVFRLLGEENENEKLKRILAEVATDIQSGTPISGALGKQPKIFSPFFVSMIKAGEESGKLDESFMYLADYLERTYEVSSKAKNALIYPGFVIFTFCAVMILMLTMVIPKISAILVDSGQEIPPYTKVVLGLSEFFVDYGFLLVIGVAVGVYFLLKFRQTEAGREALDRFRLVVPYIGDLYRKLYLSRIADNMTTMLHSGIPMVRALESTIGVVDNLVFAEALTIATEKVKGGSAVSEALSQHPEIPRIMVQMMKVGEETGNLGEILSTLARFYRREVMTAVDTLVDLIEPTMIILLGLGVGTLLASVLIPIYNLSSNF